MQCPLHKQGRQRAKIKKKEKTQWFKANYLHGLPGKIQSIYPEDKFRGKGTARLHMGGPSSVYACCQGPKCWQSPGGGSPGLESLPHFRVIRKQRKWPPKRQEARNVCSLSASPEIDISTSVTLGVGNALGFGQYSKNSTILVLPTTRALLPMCLCHFWVMSHLFPASFFPTPGMFIPFHPPPAVLMYLAILWLMMQRRSNGQFTCTSSR